MYAKPSTYEIKIAVMTDSIGIPEIGLAVDQLSNENDVHFGMNCPNFNSCVNWELRDLGARALDIENRGGRTAEDTWRWLNKGFIKVYCCLDSCGKEVGSIYPSKIQGVFGNEFYCKLKPSQFNVNVPEIVMGTDNIENATPWKCPVCGEETYYVGTRDTTRKATPNFQEFFDKFNQSKTVKLGKDIFPNTAKINAKSVGGIKKYDGINKHEMNKSSELYGLQYGTRWSKAALEHVLMGKLGKIHFHLDGLGDISKILDKSSDFSHNVTGRELRYVWRNWERFKEFVIFYNGFTEDLKAVIVETPWM